MIDVYREQVGKGYNRFQLTGKYGENFEDQLSEFEDKKGLHEIFKHEQWRIEEKEREFKIVSERDHQRKLYE